MKTLNLDLGENSYPIYIGQALLDQAQLLTDHIHGKQVMIVTNTTVAPLYLQQVKSLLNSLNVQERSKRFSKRASKIRLTVSSVLYCSPSGSTTSATLSELRSDLTF